jgi:hypothetical protein
VDASDPLWRAVDLKDLNDPPTAVGGIPTDSIGVHVESN